MEKNQRLTTILIFSTVLLFAFLTVSYALIKGPGDIYTALAGEQSCDLASGNGCKEMLQKKKDKVTGFYIPENISNYVDVPGVSRKLFGFRPRNFPGALSFGPSAVLLAAGAPAFGFSGNTTGGGDNNSTQQLKNAIQQVNSNSLVCQDNQQNCNGECISADKKCEVQIQEPCDPKVKKCPTVTTATDPKPVPEPATMVLFGVGLAGAALRRKFSA